MTALVASYAFKIYTISDQRESRLLGTGFLFIAFSYLTKALIDLFVIGEVSKGFKILNIENLNSRKQRGVIGGAGDNRW